MTMSRPIPRRLALVGGALVVVAVLGAGLAVAASPRTGTAAPASASVAFTGPGSGAGTGDGVVTLPSPQAQPATDPVPPPSAASSSSSSSKSPPSTAARATTRPTPVPPTTAAPAGPTTTPPAAAAKFTPGQRLNPSGADVAAAVDKLHQRIPLFAPTGPQLLAFADAACGLFDQGQTAAQVESTVQSAVSHIQGKSLSAADAQFAVGIVVQLRCPGYTA
jgi:hypothetical protein